MSKLRFQMIIKWVLFILPLALILFANQTLAKPLKDIIKSSVHVSWSNGNPNLRYQGHVQGSGWQNWVSNNNVAGTTGQGLRLEAIKIKLEDADGGVSYHTYVQNRGWTNWASDGAESGTTGQGLRLEAIEIRLNGYEAERYDIYYRVHVENIGWMDWAKNGTPAGALGSRIEAIQIYLVHKGDPSPGSTEKPFIDHSHYQSDYKPELTYQGHVEGVGWQEWVHDNDVCGTLGQGWRLEGMRIKLENADGRITYSSYVENRGWMDWRSDGELTGTTGQALRQEAIKIRLMGNIARDYNIYYRVNVQDMGWLGWAKNGEIAGTLGFGYRIEAVQITLVNKDEGSAGPTNDHFMRR